MLTAYMLCYQHLKRNGEDSGMFGHSFAKAPRTAIDIVRDRLEQGPPTGLRLGSPQTAGRLTLVPVFHDGPALEYMTFANAQKDGTAEITDRKSTRLNSSHLGISYAVFCLKKK